MKDQRSSIVAASRNDSITTAPSQKFQSLEKHITKSSNGWKFLFVASVMLFATAAESFAAAGFFKQYVIMNNGSLDSYYGNSMADNFNGKNLGSVYRGDLLYLDGGEANTWENGGDWVTPVTMYYRITNSVLGTPSFSSLSLNDNGTAGNGDTKWDKTDLGLKISTNAPGTYYLQVYFEAQGNYNGGNWKFYDSASPDYKASFTISAINNPSGQSATADSTTAITLNWTKSEQHNDVIIVRSADDSFTAPTQGTNYTAGSSTIGGDRVIYKGGDASFQDTGLSSNTRYYYKIYSENYSYYSSGVTTDTTTLAPATPTITVSTATLTSFGDVAVDSTSASASYTVTGADITGDITVTAPDQFKVATSSDGSYSSSITLASNGGTVYVKFAPTSAGAKSGNISHTASGASTKNVAVSGTGIAAPSAPTASAATNAATTSFYANWSAGGGGTPTNYFLDVATDSGFNNKVSGFDDKSVGNVTTYSVTGLKVGQYYYRVRAQNLAGTSGNSSTISAGTTTANTRNKGGAASPATSPSPAYRGDTVTFEFDSWGTVEGAYGKPRLWTSSSSNLTAGTAGDWGNFTNVEPKSVSRQFTTAGTYYWGIQMDYGGTYGTNFWYVRNNASWAPMYYNPTNNDLSITVSELTAPTLGSIAKDSINSATRIDLAWTKWAGRNVMITRSTAVPTGSPVGGTVYSGGNTFGNQTVLEGSTAAETYEATGLTPGQTYYFTLYSENFNYYSAGVTFTATATERPRAQNTGGGGASPGQPANLYLGDTNKLFTFESWATLEANYGRAFLWLRHNNADVSGGTRFSGAGFTNVDYKAVSSGQFTQTGTWYWGMQMDYGSPYGSNFWYKASAGTWAQMSGDGLGSTLSFTVSALGAPTGFDATTDGPNAIDLAWTRWTGGDSGTRNVLIVRKAGSAVTWTPTQGTAYSNGQDVGDGHTVIRGSLAANVFEDTGLTAGTTYHYAIFSENYRYYSTAATASDTTAKQSQTITFNALGNKTYGDSSFPVSATADSGLTVSFSSLDESVATVDGTTVTIVGAGTATIRASQAGNATYDAAPNVDRSFTVSPKAITGSFTAENKTYNGNTSATVASRSLTGVINDDVVTLSGGTATFDTATAGNGKTVTLTGATLTGTDAGNYTLTSVSTTTANITKANQTITFAGGPWTTKTEGDPSFDLAASSTSGLTISFASSDAEVATISGSNVSIVGVGSATITASQAGNENYNAAPPVTQTLTVNPPGGQSPPLALAASMFTTSSFQANWGAVEGAINYYLDVGLGANFNTLVVNGRSVAGDAISSAVTGLTPGGSYRYRVRVVTEAGTSDNSNVITLTLPSAAVAEIQGLPEGEVEFAAVEGVEYKILASTSADPVSGSWTMQETAIATNSTVTAEINEADKIFYQVVPSGANASTSPSAIWGIIKPTVNPGYTMMSPPLVGNRDLSGEGSFGESLAAVLVNGDELYLRRDGDWVILERYDGAWLFEGQPTDITLNAGEGFYISSAVGAPVKPRFTGQVGNTGGTTVTLSPGWNIVGPAEGRTRTFNQIASGIVSPYPGLTADTADLIVIDEGASGWRRIMRTSTGWRDLKSGGTTPTISFEPGQAVYYFRQSAPGGTTMSF